MNQTRNILSLSQAEQLFTYRPDRGDIVRKVTTGPTAREGSELPARQVEINGKAYCVKKLAWLLCHGEFPRRPVILLDGDAKNLRPGNMILSHNCQDENDVLAVMADVRRVLSYNPNDGAFRWTAFIGEHRPGDLAGWEHSAGYIVIPIFGAKIYAHRLAFAFLTGAFPVDVVDHISGDRKDNSWGNLRDVTQGTNVENRTSALSENSLSGLLGVHWNSQRGRWHAEIKVAGKKVHLGFFHDRFEAHEAYLRAKRSLHEGCTL